MLKEKENVILQVNVLLDVVCISLAYVIAFSLRKTAVTTVLSGLFPTVSSGMHQFTPSFSEHAFFVISACLFWCLILYFNGMYRSIRTLTFLQISWISFKSTILTMFLSATLLFLFRVEFMSRSFFILFIVLSAFFILGEKFFIYIFLHYVRAKVYNNRRLLIVGTGKRAIAFIKKIENRPEWGFQIIGAIDDEPGRGIESVNGVKILGALEDIPRIFHEKGIDEVIFVVPRSRLNSLENAIRDCETEGVVVTIAVDLFNMELANSSVTELDGTPLLHFKTTVAKEWQLFLKRMIDLTFSGLGLIILSPFFLIVSVLIKWTSPGPVFFRQERLGLNGRRFRLFKFRTMQRGAHDELSKVSDLSEMDTPEFQKKKIAWITPLGRVFRKFSIDEYPQLINVFLGQMSLVGPRPTVPDEVQKYKTWQRRRLSMKPGITCLWQVKGRNKIGFEEWMKLDLEYLDGWSLWLDFKILVRTIPVVVFGIGAY